MVSVMFWLSQEEYRSEGISWHMIDYIDNTACINLISKKPTALLHLLDEECKCVSTTSQKAHDISLFHSGLLWVSVSGSHSAVMRLSYIIHVSLF